MATELGTQREGECGEVGGGGGLFISSTFTFSNTFAFLAGPTLDHEQGLN